MRCVVGWLVQRKYEHGQGRDLLEAAGTDTAQVVLLLLVHRWNSGAVYPWCSRYCLEDAIAIEEERKTGWILLKRGYWRCQIKDNCPLNCSAPKLYTTTYKYKSHK